ncbi:MAG: FAD/NAD(P)-binding oxidoreductase [Rhodospirillales bacterium 70-18]|nr:MAG: FAD/NAD(P)-binding oxidoreductase [Rhodospirillales bacterium 70-18]
MSAPVSTVAVVGAGPAGTRAAEVLVRAGLRPVVLDEAPDNGGRIFQRPPPGFTRPYEALYGSVAPQARALHAAFDGLRGRVDYRPSTLAWHLRPGTLHTLSDGQAGQVDFAQAILCTGAMDRVVPLPGWTRPGVTTLGGAQIALKTQGCAIGRRVAFLGTGPLLWLVAMQYAKAGATVAAVLDTTPLATKARQAPALLAGGRAFLTGLRMMAWPRLHGVKVVEGATPLEITGTDGVDGLRYRGGGREHVLACDAVAMGWGLKPETQLADLAGVPFDFDLVQRLHLPRRNDAGRTPVVGIYLAGDGARIGGAELAELQGARAAWSVVEDRGLPLDLPEIARLDRAIAAQAGFRRALDLAFPYPHALAAEMPDATTLCRCEAVTAGELRAAAAPHDLNRAKALTRLGMGRCQGRVCGPPGAEVLAAALGCEVSEVGRLRGQWPVKPVPLSMAAE